MAKCTNCGATLSDSANFCHECGTKVIKAMYCTACGYQIDPSNKFCPYCGTPTQNGGKQKPAPAPRAEATLKDVKGGLFLVSLIAEIDGEEQELVAPFTYRKGKLIGYDIEDVELDEFIDLSEYDEKETFPLDLEDYDDLDEFAEAIVNAVVVETYANEFPDGGPRVKDDEVTVKLYNKNRDEIYSHLTTVEIDYGDDDEDEDEEEATLEDLEDAYMILSFNIIRHDEDEDEDEDPEPEATHQPYTFENGKLYRYATDDTDDICAHTDVNELYRYDGVEYDLDEYDDLDEFAEDLIAKEGSEFVEALEDEGDEVEDNEFILTIYNKDRKEIFKYRDWV